MSGNGGSEGKGEARGLLRQIFVFNFMGVLIVGVITFIVLCTAGYLWRSQKGSFMGEVEASLLPNRAYSITPTSGAGGFSYNVFAYGCDGQFTLNGQRARLATATERRGRCEQRNVPAPAEDVYVFEGTGSSPVLEVAFLKGPRWNRREIKAVLTSTSGDFVFEQVKKRWSLQDISIAVLWGLFVSVVVWGANKVLFGIPRPRPKNAREARPRSR